MRIMVIDPTLVVQCHLGNIPRSIPGIHDRRRVQTVTQTNEMSQLMQRHSTFDRVGRSIRHLTTVDVCVRVRTLPEANEANDEQLSNAAMAIHPRAVNKTGGLLDFMRKRDAQLAIQYQDSRVELTSSEDIERVAKRLNPANVEDRTTQVTGTMTGVLPTTRQFELAPFGGPPIQGRIAPDIRDPYQTAREFTNRRVSATIRTIRIGRGAPRHTLVDVFQLTTA